ncbi:ketosamine-3-kinase-like [Amphiura filiformis]|uniref:ketosamine-3-kinase-like n=1 Tax=Amphiura filiformis TaxID=82378 RepID=UPI003B211D6D
MEAILKSTLGVTHAKSIGRGGGGCISEGQTYETNKGKYFVKVNHKSEAMRMFEGEAASLDAILATNIVKVPKPEKVIRDDKDGGAILIMEHVDMSGLRKYQAELGEQLARLHLHNEDLGNRLSQEGSRVGDAEAGAKYVPKFGFHCTTCCGYIPQNNEWTDNWVEFYARHRLKLQLDLVERDYGDREARELWPQLERNLPGFFKDIKVKPALLHGDLWGGNVAETDTGPVIFDPASHYGHSEFDLAIAGMFGGFNSAFYSAYHKMIPKAPGFETRSELYKLFHYLNHWNHFGSGYRTSSLSIMRRLAKSP